MPFNNPILAGEELIRTAIRSENYTEDGEGGPGSGWAINRDGSATFNNLNVRGIAEGPSASYDVVSANNSLLYKGEELSDVLMRLPQGMVAFGQIGPGSFSALAGVMQHMVELDFQIPANVPTNRAYRIHTNFVRNNTPTVGGENPRFLLGYTLDGSQPILVTGTTAVLGIAQTHTHPTVNGRDQATMISEVLYPGPTATRIRVVLGVQGEFGFRVDMPYDAIKLFIEDLGPAVQNQAINRYTGSSTGRQFKQWEVSANAFRSYTGAGAYDRADYMFQGNVAGPGNRRSWAWFPMTDISDLNGVNISDVQYLDLYLFYPHWWNSGGGQAVVGWHSQGAVGGIGTPEYNSGFAKQQFTYPFPGRNIGQWIDIKGSTVGTSMLSGLWRGIILGEAPNASNIYYGYASDIRIRAGYWK